MKGLTPNPYFNMAIIQHPMMFYGRRQLLRQFYELVFNRQSVSLLGPRRIGKSSFLWCTALPEIQERSSPDLSHHLFVFLDLREYLNKTSEDFFHSVSKEMIVHGAKRGLSLQAEGQGQDEFSGILDEIAAKNFFPVLMLDGFDQVTRNKHFGPEFFWFLRAQANAGLVSYVTASKKPLYDVCHSDIVGSPFFNIFYAYKLEALTPEEAYALITVPAAEAGMPLSDEEVGLVLKLAGRHPFFIQRVCYALYEEKLLRDGNTIDEQHLKNLAYRDLLPHFQSTWEELSETDQLLLQDEAQQKERQQRKLPELSESAFFRQFVRNTCKAQLFHMTTTELKNALKNIDNAQALSITNLRLMKAVSQRLVEDPNLPAAKRGVVIHEILHEAFENLCGSGVRSDAAPEWRLYNILHYRYFKYHYKHELIARKLECTSTRQYYRERNKALESLLNVLLEMEHTVGAHE